MRAQDFRFGNMCALLPTGPQLWLVTKTGYFNSAKNEDFPDFATIHCVIRHNVLRAEVLYVTNVKDTEILNSVRARNLRRRLFRTQLEENEAQYEHLLLYNDVV